MLARIEVCSKSATTNPLSIWDDNVAIRYGERSSGSGTESHNIGLHAQRHTIHLDANIEEYEKLQNDKV